MSKDKKNKKDDHRRKKCDESQPLTITSGPLFRNANTDFFEVSVLNVTDSPQTVTVSVFNQQNTCSNGDGFPKYGYLCGELINDTSDGTTLTSSDGTDSDLFYPPTPVTPVLIPFTFTIPPRQRFSIQAFPPQPITPPNPYYEVRVTFLPQPFAPPDPIFPPGTIRPIIVNTWGISSAGVIQAGNTVLHGQFRFWPPGPVTPPPSD